MLFEFVFAICRIFHYIDNKTNNLYSISCLTNYIDKQKEDGNDVDLGTNTGIYIESVEDRSTAEELGLQKGDVVTAVDGRSVTKMAELQEALSQRRPGDKVKVTYIRNKKSHTESATLRNAQGGTEVLEEVDIDLFGAQLKPLSDETKQQLALRYGLEVTAIKKASPPLPSRQRRMRSLPRKRL